MKKELSLRDKKKAMTKLELLSTLDDLLVKSLFEDITVKEICDRASISSVTFFKYFKRKEDLLLYYQMVWNYKRELTFIKQPRPKGKQAIIKIFEDIATTNNAPIVMNTLIRHFTKLLEISNDVVLLDSEKSLISSKVLLQEELSIESQFILAYDEAIILGEIDPSIAKEEYLFLVTTLFYGTPIFIHHVNKSLQELYKQNLDLLFRLTEPKNKTQII